MVLDGTIAVSFAYLCAGELLPYPLIESSKLLQAWAVQEVLLLAALSCLAVLSANASCRARKFNLRQFTMSAGSLLLALNSVPLAASIITLRWSLLSDNCPVRPGESCDPFAIALDVIGLVSARLARLDLGISLLLTARGPSAWLYGATAGRLGYAEAIPLHRSAGWWCARQAALHSVAYLLFYLETGGLRSLWHDCLPTSNADGQLNRLGLVNFFGVLAFVLLLPLALPALPHLRKRLYHRFQRLHLPAAAFFVLCCALHDLPMLLFAAPGLAGWYLEWRARPIGDGVRRRLPARARLLPGTSGPWVELTVECHGVAAEAHAGCPAPRGQWVSLRILPLGSESHPLSVAAATSASGGGVDNTPSTTLSVLISGRAGDWARALVALAACQPAAIPFEVEVDGPYPFGGGSWTLGNGGSLGRGNGHEDEPSLLLLAGGTGVTAWLPALKSGGSGASRMQRRVHLVWCVRTEGDLAALAPCLPLEQVHGVAVTVFVTRASGASGEHLPSPSTMSEAGGIETATLASSFAACSADAAVPAAAFSAAMSCPEAWGAVPSCSAPSCSAVPPRGGSSSSASSSAAAVSLAATLVGLLIGHWGWSSLEAVIGPRFPSASATNWADQTQLGYTLTRRCLPIVIIVASMAATTAVCCWALSQAPVCVLGRSRRAVESGSVCPQRPEQPLFTGFSSSSSQGGGGLPPPPQEDGLAGEGGEQQVNTGGHDVRFGRPDVDALVCDAAARRGASSQRLVVAACGTRELVEAARKAVAAARRQFDRIEFSGGDSAW